MIDDGSDVTRSAERADWPRLDLRRQWRMQTTTKVNALILSKLRPLNLYFSM